LDTRGRYKEAIETYQKALQQKPNWYEPLHNLGITLCKRDQHERAIEIFTDILERDPGNYRIQNNMGVTLLDQGRGPEAVQYFKQALEEAPNYKIAEDNLDRALARTQNAAGDRDLKQAFDPLDMILITDPLSDAPASPSGGLPSLPLKTGEPEGGASWEFPSLDQSAVVSLLKYLMGLSEYLPEHAQKKFSESAVRSDLNYLIDTLQT
jgi:tetratricopeptide (TPR) repeat protein